MTRSVLVGTIGYHNLRNHSLGPILQSRIEALDWDAGVEVDEMNWGPIAIVQKFEAMPEPKDRVVLLAATGRDRPVGTVTHYHWQGGIPSLASVQERVAEAVTGVTSLDNLLVIGEYFKIWPPQTVVIDVEPGAEESGETLTVEMEACIPDILQALHTAATAVWDDLPPMEGLHGGQFELS